LLHDEVVCRSEVGDTLDSTAFVNLHLPFGPTGVMNRHARKHAQKGTTKTTMATNAETNDQAATVAEQGAAVEPKKAPAKKCASQRKGAPKGSLFSTPKSLLLIVQGPHSLSPRTDPEPERALIAEHLLRCLDYRKRWRRTCAAFGRKGGLIWANDLEHY
jgi:hypothetical protein